MVAPAVLWPVQHEAALRGHVGRKAGSFAQITALLNAEFKTEYSRCAVIGKVKRMGLTHVNTQSATPRSRAPAVRLVVKQPPAFKPIELVRLRCEEIVPRHLKLVELKSNDCRYPYGDRDFTFCGHPKMPGSPYCEPHFQLSRRNPFAEAAE